MRRGRGPETLLLVTGILGGAAAATVGAPGRRPAHVSSGREEAFRMTGGLGLGATVDPSTCAYGFDPRLEDRCGRRHGPLLGDEVTCPHHRGLLPPPR